jgi:hypothetical protein
MTASESDEEQRKTPDPFDDEFLNKEIDERMRVGRSVYSAFQVEWFRNILYSVGEHYVRFDKGRWRRKNIPKYWPRVVTNKVIEKVNDFVSILMRGRVPITYSPASADPDDVATADMEERIRDVIYEEAAVEHTEAMQAAWVATTGNVYRTTSYDNSPEHGESEPIQQMRCGTCQGEVSPSDAAKQQCSICAQSDPPSQGGPFTPAVDEMGQPITKVFPIGCLDSDVCSPFEIRADYTIPDDRLHRWYIRLRIYDKDVAKRNWAQFETQIDAIEDPEPGADEAQSIFYLAALSRVTRSFTGGGGGNDGKLEGKVLAYELVTLPSKKYPDGLHVVRIGPKLIVEKSGNPFQIAAGQRKGKKFLNLVHFGGEVVPGRYFRKTRINDILSLQDYRNVIEAVIKLTVHRAGGPSWLNPIGSQVDKFSGEPLQVIDYMPITFGGASLAKPEMVAPQLQSLIVLERLLNKIDDSIERISGTFFLQGGDAPPNISAASALSLLDERAQRAVSPLIREWAKGWKLWEGQAIEIMRTHAVDERFYAAAGRDQKWDVQKFTKADLKGAVNVKVDYEGVMPRSQATQRATVVQLTQLGYLTPFDPEIQRNVLAQFGLAGIRGGVDKDWKEAAKEYRDYMDHDLQPMLLPIVQKSPIHLEQHCNDAKGDEFRSHLLSDDPAKKAKAQGWLAHIQATAADIQAAAALRVSSAGGVGADGQGGGEDGLNTQVGTQAGAQAGNTAPLGQTPDILAPQEAAPPVPGQ